VLCAVEKGAEILVSVSNPRRHLRRALVGVVCAVLLTGCATAATDNSATLQASPAFVENGRTTKDELRERLGQPSAEFDEGRIWTYRHLDAAYHLVVLFGEGGVVKKHRMVNVRQ
jgi:hypothetical protein